MQECFAESIHNDKSFAVVLQTLENDAVNRIFNVVIQNQGKEDARGFVLRFINGQCVVMHVICLCCLFIRGIIVQEEREYGYAIDWDVEIGFSMFDDGFELCHGRRFEAFEALHFCEARHNKMQEEVRVVARFVSESATCFWRLSKLDLDVCVYALPIVTTVIDYELIGKVYGGVLYPNPACISIKSADWDDDICLKLYNCEIAMLENQSTRNITSAEQKNLVVFWKHSMNLIQNWEESGFKDCVLHNGVVAATMFVFHHRILREVFHKTIEFGGCAKVSVAEEDMSMDPRNTAEEYKKLVQCGELVVFTPDEEDESVKPEFMLLCVYEALDPIDAAVKQSLEKGFVWADAFDFEFERVQQFFPGQEVVRMCHRRPFAEIDTIIASSAPNTMVFMGKRSATCGKTITIYHGRPANRITDFEVIRHMYPKPVDLAAGALVLGSGTNKKIWVSQDPKQILNVSPELTVLYVTSDVCSVSHMHYLCISETHKERSVRPLELLNNFSTQELLNNFFGAY